MQTSLEKWAKSTNAFEPLTLTEAYFTEQYDEYAASLTLRKGFCPYEWVTSWERFQSREGLLPPEAFASKLSGLGDLRKETTSTHAWYMRRWVARASRTTTRHTSYVMS